MTTARVRTCRARLELEETPPSPQLSAFFEEQIQAGGRTLAEQQIPSRSLQEPATASMSTTRPGELGGSFQGRPAAPATKPRGKHKRIEPIDPAEFVALVLTSVRDDFVRTALAGPRASELCLMLTISILGEPRGGPWSRFTGPVYSLRRVTDALHALDIYRRLDRAYVAKKRPKALADLVAKIAEEQADDRRSIWFQVREIFDAGTGRERFEKVIARQAAGADLSDVELPFGTQRYRAQGDHAERLVALFEQAFASGMGPALGHAVFDTLAQRLKADGVLQPLPRAPGFKVALSFGTLRGHRRTEFSIG